MIKPEEIKNVFDETKPITKGEEFTLSFEPKEGKTELNKVRTLEELGDRIGVLRARAQGQSEGSWAFGAEVVFDVKDEAKYQIDQTKEKPDESLQSLPGTAFTKLLAQIGDQYWLCLGEVGIEDTPMGDKTRRITFNQWFPVTGEDLEKISLVHKPARPLNPLTLKTDQLKTTKFKFI